DEDWMDKALAEQAAVVRSNETARISTGQAGTVAWRERDASDTDNSRNIIKRTASHPLR
ncbi:hypothetical protein EV178_006655, partial [Coemansia sp. RSA 1646]